MRKKQTYAVFGLGRYGRAVAAQLAQNGAEVLAVDRHPERVNEAIADIPLCRCADVTDPEVLEQLDIGEFDVVIVAMGTNLENAILATMLCKEAGVEKVVVKCANELHRRILERVGADMVVFPEIESGIRLANNLMNSGFADIFELSPDSSMLELEIRPEWENRTLAQLNLRKKYGINVIAIRQPGTVTTDIDPNITFTKDMRLIVIANNQKLKKLD